LGKEVHHPPDIPDQRHVEGRRDALQRGRHQEHAAERPRILHQEWKEPPGRRILLLVSDIGIDKALEEPEHRGAFRVAGRIYIRPADRGTQCRTSSTTESAMRPAMTRLKALSRCAVVSHRAMAWPA